MNSKIDFIYDEEFDFTPQIDDFESLSVKWKENQRLKRKIEEEEQILKSKLTKFCSGDAIERNGLKIKKVIRKGAIDYSKIFELSLVDLEMYRKESTEYYQISLGYNNE